MIGQPKVIKMDNLIPTEDEITDLLSRIQPRPEPRFNQQMANQPWNRERRFSFLAGFSSIKTATTLGLLLLLILGVNLFFPSLNTLAQRFSLFFSPSPSSQATGAIAPLETSHPLERFNLSISEAETLAGFQMKTCSIVSQEFHLIGATYDELREAVILHYTIDSGGLVLRISQQKVDSDYQGIGPEALIEIVTIGPYSGEFVSGGWKILEVESGTDATQNPNAAQAVWETNVNLQTLRWSDGEFLYEIILAGGRDQPEYLDKDGLIALAKSMH